MQQAPAPPENKTPPKKENYDHLIPHANSALRFTLKAGWYLAKGLVKIAVRLPRLFVRANQAPTEQHSRPRH